MSLGLPLPPPAITGRECWLALLLAAPLLLRPSCLLAQQAEPDPVFQSALADILPQTPVPILLPSKLRSVVRIGEIQLAAGELRKHGYFISLCYSDPCSGATYAAGFGASRRITAPKDLPNTLPVELANNRTGLFRPVSCGGSCAPANLLWVQGGVHTPSKSNCHPTRP